MKTKELLESVGIKFNSNGFCVVTQTDVNRALKAYSAQQIKEIDRLTEELGYERSIQKEEYQILKDLFEKRGSAMQDLSEQVALLSTKSDELREALSESELQAQVAITGNDILDSENKQMKIAIKDFLLFIESGKGEYPTILLSRCRKLIGE